jgi:hypothetical protein
MLIQILLASLTIIASSKGEVFNLQGRREAVEYLIPYTPEQRVLVAQQALNMLYVRFRFSFMIYNVTHHSL